MHERNAVQLAEFELSTYAAGKKGTKNQNGKRSSGLIFHISAPGFLEVGGSIRRRAQTLHFPTLWRKKNLLFAHAEIRGECFSFPSDTVIPPLWAICRIFIARNSFS